MTFDLANRLISLATPDGAATTYMYDLLDREIESQQSSPTWTRETVFNALGDITLRQHIDDTGATTELYSLSYDAVSNRISISDISGNLFTHQYDPKNRLTTTTVTGPNASQILYSYDANDNTLTNNESGSTLSLSYDSANRKTTGVSVAGTFTFTYDQNGNLVLVRDASGLTTMAYDKENRITSQYQPDGSSVTYSYHADGMKRSELVAGSLTTLVWDGEDYLQGRQ